MTEQIDHEEVPKKYSMRGGKLYDSLGNCLSIVPQEQHEAQVGDQGRESENTKPIIPAITFREFSQLEFPKERWLIENLIPTEGIVIIASPSGEKKTWLAMEMAKCIANGSDFLQNPEFKTREGNVLYIDQEMSKTELQRRGNLLGLNDTKQSIYLVSGENLDFSTEEDGSSLYETIAEYDIKAVFVDTLRAVAGGLHEDKAEDVRQFLDVFKPLKDKGVAIIFLDHCRKPNFKEGRTSKKEQLLGSQDKVASVEALIMLRSNERDEEILIYPLKNRSGVEHKPFRVEMKDEVDEKLLPIKTVLSYAGGIEEKEYKVDEAKNAIIYLLEENRSRKEILEVLQMENNIGGKNASAALKELKAAGKVSIKKRGKENIYSLVRNDDTDVLFGELASSTTNDN